MEHKETLNKLEEIYENLPKVIVDFLESPELNSLIKKISDKHALLIPETEKIDNEILLVLMGEKKAADFVKNLTAATGFDYTKANKIAADVNKEIFEKIRKKMMEENSEEKSSDNEAPNKDEMMPEEKPIQKENPESLIVEKSVTYAPPPPSPMSSQKNGENLDRGSLLKEIEEAGEPKIEMDEDKSFLKGNIDAKPEISRPAPSPTSVFEKKLTSNTEQTIKEKEVMDEKKHPSKGFDPYREPIDS